MKKYLIFILLNIFIYFGNAQVCVVVIDDMIDNINEIKKENNLLKKELYNFSLKISRFKQERDRLLEEIHIQHKMYNDIAIANQKTDIKYNGISMTPITTISDKIEMDNLTKSLDNLTKSLDDANNKLYESKNILLKLQEIADKAKKDAEYESSKAKEYKENESIAILQRDSLEKTEYQMCLKNDSIETLKQDALGLAKKEEHQKNIATSFGGLASLLMFIACIGFVYVRKQKKEIEVQNAQIRQKNEFIASQEHELRHRIKNSLQRLYRRINEQLKYSQMGMESIQEVTLIRERVNALTLLYQAFHQYRKEGSEEVDLATYLSQLLSHIGDTEDTQINTVFEKSLFDVERSEYVGLFINEAITNIFKHAFKGFGVLEKKNITVHLRHSTENEIELRIAHNGNDISNIQPLTSIKGKGMDFLSGLAERLRGKFWLEGSITFLSFPIQIKGNNK